MKRFNHAVTVNHICWAGISNIMDDMVLLS